MENSLAVPQKATQRILHSAVKELSTDPQTYSCTGAQTSIARNVPKLGSTQMPRNKLMEKQNLYK